MKQLVFRLLPLLMLLIGSAASAQGLRFQYNGSSNLTTEQANADIDTLINMMERIHPDLYANRSERSFKRDVASLHKHFAKQDSVNKFDLYIALIELISPFNYSFFADAETKRLTLQKTLSPFFVSSTSPFAVKAISEE